jgi:hypothetical protein
MGKLEVLVRRGIPFVIAGLCMVAGPSHGTNVGRAADRGEAKSIPFASPGSYFEHLGSGPAPVLASAPKSSGERAGRTLLGELAGDWSSVTGFLTFPYVFDSAPELGTMQVLIRGFVVEREPGTDIYRAPAWDGKAYWLRFDVDGGLEASAPRLIPAAELSTAYDPAVDTRFPELGNEPGVAEACAGGVCSLQWLSYLELRQQGVDYSSYPDGAATAGMLFVADANGDAIAAVLDINDATGTFARRDYLYIGDELKLYTNAYRMSEPDALFLVEYADFESVQAGFMIERAHYTPDADYPDPAVPDDVDGTNRPLRLVLMGESDAKSDGAGFAYGGPFPLGFTWGQVPSFVFGGSFEALVQVDDPATVKATGRLAKQRPSG